MKLTHLGISFFRSIGADPVTIDLRKKVTVLVGANNCGKSNVLRALDRVCSHRNKEGEFLEIDYHRRAKERSPRFLLTAEAENNDEDALRYLERVTIDWNGCEHVRSESDCADFDRLEFASFNKLYERFARHYFNRVVDRDRMRKEYPPTANGITELLIPQIPKSCLIPQFRQIRGGDSYSIEGNGIVKLLASWQHPEIGRDRDYEKYLQVQDLLRKLTQMPNVILEVGHKHDEIIVKKDLLRLPLAAFGTGLHELIILAIAVLSQEETLVFIEEPEIHLHPLLQQRLIEFLGTETNNRYVITTHSPALIIPRADIDVIHLWMKEGITQSRSTETAEHSLHVLRDLGVRASDLLQSNSVFLGRGSE